MAYVGKYKANMQLGYGPTLNANLPFTLPSLRLKNASVIGDIFGGVIIVVLGSSLFGTVANFTTGIPIAHTGFTPNQNVTQSTGFVPIIHLIPLVFGAMLPLMLFSLSETHLPCGSYPCPCE